jgi:predicted 2-oxoglutarate/Fe(II)-dependent dioxygenase YbiX
MTRSFLPAGTFTGLCLDGLMSDDDCRALRDRVEAAGFAATGRGYPDGYRNNDRLVFDDPALAAALFERARAALPPILDAGGRRWVLVGLNPRFRACRYRDGQQFCIHRDGPHCPDDDTRSWLTLQIYLDDGGAFAGGRTRFYADADGAERWAAVEPVRGRAIVFDHRAWHDGEAVTRGVKRVLRTDVMYRAETVAPRAVDTLGRHRGYVWRVVARGDGSIASSGRDGTVRIWRGDTPAVHELGAGSVTALVESGGQLWCGTRGGEILAIDPATGPARVARLDGAVLDLAAVPGGVVAALASGQLVRLGAGARSAEWSVQVHDGWAWSVAPLRTAHGDAVISCGDDGRLVTVSLQGEIRALDLRGVSLRAVAVTEAGAVLAGDAHGRVHRRGAQPLVAHDAAITALAGAGALWVSASEDGRVRVWYGVRCIDEHVADDAVRSVALTPTGVAWAGYDSAVRFTHHRW